MVRPAKAETQGKAWRPAGQGRLDLPGALGRGSPPLHRDADLQLNAGALDAHLGAAEGDPSAMVEWLEPLLDRLEGIETVLERMPAIVRAGFFEGTVWEDPARLRPPLVKGSLLGPGGIYESMSELRLLAVALGRVRLPDYGPKDATAFLQEAVVLNLDLVQMGASEQHRIAGGPALARARRVIGLIVERLPFERFEGVLVREIDAICRQRRILTAAALDMIERAERYARADGNRAQRRLAVYVRAVRGVTPLAREAGEPEAYRQALLESPAEALDAEAKAHGRTLRDTGLSGPRHAVLLQVLRERCPPAVLARALGLDRVGRAELWRHGGLVDRLVRHAVTPATPIAIAGLAGCLDRTVLSQIEVAAGLRNLLQRPPCEEAAERLVASRPYASTTDPHALLLAGALAVLGQPLGIGQGDNPSCQGARGMSLWSQVAPGYLLELLTQAAYENRTRIRFRGVELDSHDLPAAPMGTELRLDPASVVLIPHLQRTYQAMLEQVRREPGDPHRYVNPGLYGPWVPTSFAWALNPELPLKDFFRRFLAVHHPDVAEVEPIHPRPLGMVVTGVDGRYLGLHAISLLRVAATPKGELRAYFFNPNDDGRQDWGQGIAATTSGHGERAGESSVPLVGLASRVYAFHHHEHEVIHADRVGEDLVAEATRLAESSWWPHFRMSSPQKRPR